MLEINDSKVVNYAKSLTPSERGEIEITDLNNIYLKKGELKVKLFISSISLAFI